MDEFIARLREWVADPKQKLERLAMHLGGAQVWGRCPG